MPAISIRRLAPALLDDWLAFFDHDAHNYHGPLILYLHAGFEACREVGDVVVVRRRLAEPSGPVRGLVGG